MLLNATAQDTYRAEHWDIENGLSLGAVTAMLRDVNGFLWIGTWEGGGLNRFDGINFRNYLGDKNDNKNIIGDYVNRIIEDSLHNIWIGTTEGLSRYDIKADTFTHFIGSPEPDIVPLCATRDSVYCLEGHSNFTAYNIRSFRKKHLVTISRGEHVTYDGATPYTIFDPGSNSIWIIEGVADRPGGGLYQVSLDGTRKHYSQPCYKHIPFHSHCAEGMCYDRKRNCIWINSNDGLVQFTLRDKQFHYVDAIDKLKSLNNYIKRETGWQHWVGIDIDPQDRIWLASVEKGIAVYDPGTGTAFQPVSANDIAHQISDWNGSLYCDRDGIAWSGFWSRKGLYELLPFSQALTHYTAGAGPDSLSSADVLNCINGEDGNAWIGTSRGLNIFDPRTGTFKVLYQKDLPGFPSKKIIPVSIDTVLKKAWLWGGWGGNTIYQMDIRSRKCRPIVFDDSPGHEVSDIDGALSQPYGEGCIVAVSGKDSDRIFMVDGDTTLAKEILSFPDGTIRKLNAIQNNGLLFIRTGSAANLAYENSGEKWIRRHNALDTIAWTHIAFSEADQSYWVTVKKQLIHFDRNFREIHRYKQKDGLPEIDIFNLVADNNGNVWFNTYKSILQLNVRTGIITALSEKDGFGKQDFNETYMPAVKDIYGNVYFPGGPIYGEGFDFINPYKFRETYPPSAIYLQSLQIDQEPFKLPTGVNDLQKLQLKHFQNNIAIETGIIDYYSKGKSQIRYKLEGLNKDWQYAPAYYTIRYDALSANNYKLIMQAGNVAGEFNGPEKILLINIIPAWWNTWWFRTLVAICVIAITYVLIRWRVRQKFQLQLERSEKEKQLAENAKQLAELQQQKTEVEMQALRAQMNPHFIFNCLNAINRFILTNETEAAANYLTKFSRLVRMVLSNSEEAFIPLEDELTSLHLYIDLEKLRFKKPFEYTIKISDTVDPANIAIPPLLLQPFVENAIWHGLVNKADEGHLSINIQQENSTLLCTIADDGVGREKAAALKNKSANHKSMGMRITESRIAMLQKMNGENRSVEIRDVFDAEGNAAGTEVVLKIPLAKEVIASDDVKLNDGF
jgi:ligand-binding sensor domain-containing protein